MRLAPKMAALRRRSTSPTAKDPLWPKVALLVTGSAEGATSFTDESPNAFTVSRFGDTQGDSGVQLQGGNSILFDGAGDYLTTPDHANIELGSGDFTIDCMVRFASVAVTQHFMAKYNSSSNRRSWFFGYSTTAGGLQFAWSTDGTALSTVLQSWSPSTGVDYHLRVCRAGSVVRLFINGVYQTQASISGSLFNDDGHVAGVVPLSIGCSFSGSGVTAPLNGSMAEARITRAARNSSNNNFTPPTARWLRS